MGILVPAFFGLSLFIGGLIVFYMFRKQYSEQVISSNLLWEQVMNEWQATKWWKKLQRQLLLLLQILILLLMMLALTRPFFHKEGIDGEHVILLLDTSASMATVIDEEGTTRFEQAKTEMRALLDKRSDEQAVSIIAVGAVPSLVLNREQNERAIMDAVGDISLTYEHSEFQRALSLAKALSQQQSSGIYVFSDRMTEEELAEIDIDGAFHANNIEAAEDDNVSVMTFGVNTSGDQGAAIVTLKNESSAQQEVTLQLLADGDRVHTQAVSLEAKEEAYINVEDLPAAVYYTARLAEKDSYPLDNAAYAFSSSTTKPVLYLIGEVNPFLHKVFIHLGHDVIQAEKLSDINEFAADSIIVITTGGDEQADQVLAAGRPFLLLASGEEEAYPLEASLETKNTDELFAYTDVAEIYISQGRGQPFEKAGLADAVMKSGDVPLVQKGLADGQSFVQLLFDLQDSDWPLHASFPIFIYNTLDYLQGEAAHLGYFTPKEQRALQLDTAGEYSVVDETGMVIDTFDGDSELFQAPEKPGLYYLADSDDQRKYFAVTLDDREKQTVAEATFSMYGNEAAPTTNVVRSEWWLWLLFAAFVILIVEWEVYRRGIRT
ncbi:von Willebrand factor type A domain-containing protein [Evansella caseinilytica]|uniref:von Willebrand factor type A domain-containing protein n=1 Tax=Evansella caseinilytica TaxID=1503961 RepID=A0A1H3HGM9_9BACI|nr:VWA domain-containing protein [Evansella caseinilytica]SDY13944.1 von Willebrand factor type A domain-containing protein [Evansella caseinilytica]